MMSHWIIFDIWIICDRSAFCCCCHHDSPGTHLPEHSRFYNPNLANMFVALTWQIMIQAGHNFAHAMTAELSWHVQNFDLIGSLESNFEQTKLSQDNDYGLINSLWNKPLITPYPLHKVTIPPPEHCEIITEWSNHHHHCLLLSRVNLYWKFQALLVYVKLSTANKTPGDLTGHCCGWFIPRRPIFNWLQLTYRLGTDNKFHLQLSVPDLQMSCSHMTGYQDNSLSN